MEAAARSGFHLLGGLQRVAVELLTPPASRPACSV
jgi:hypothetical protein